MASTYAECLRCMYSVRMLAYIPRRFHQVNRAHPLVPLVIVVITGSCRSPFNATLSHVVTRTRRRTAPVTAWDSVALMKRLNVPIYLVNSLIVFAEQPLSTYEVAAGALPTRGRSNALLVS